MDQNKVGGKKYATFTFLIVNIFHFGPLSTIKSIYTTLIL